MGLKILPENDSIILYEKGKVDAWGISSATELKRELNCFIKGAEASTPVESKGGKMVLPSFTVSFNGDVEIHVGDHVEVEGIKKVVLTKSQKKDFSRKVVITKITV